MYRAHAYQILVCLVCVGACRPGDTRFAHQSRRAFLTETARNDPGVHPAHQSTNIQGFATWVAVLWCTERIPNTPKTVRRTRRRTFEYVLFRGSRRARAPALRDRARWLSLCSTTSSLDLSRHPRPALRLQTREEPSLRHSPPTTPLPGQKTRRTHVLSPMRTSTTA